MRHAADADELAGSRTGSRGDGSSGAVSAMSAPQHGQGTHLAEGGGMRAEPPAAQRQETGGKWGSEQAA
jgi:hypothetical protein